MVNNNVSRLSATAMEANTKALFAFITRMGFIKAERNPEKYIKASLLIGKNSYSRLLPFEGMARSS